VPKEPDAAAVASLAAIVTVLTFLSAFVSVRLHGAYREALERKRQLDLQLVSGRETFPASEMVDAYESVRQTLPETLATPVLGVLAVFTGLGIWLAVLTGRAAHLRWFDSRAPDRFYGLALLALALVAVTALVGADYMRLRRRLGSAIASSPVHQILRAEELIGTAWIDKQRWHNASEATGWATIARVLLAGEREQWEEKLDKLNKLPDQQRDAAWERGRAAGEDLLALNGKLIAWWNTTAAKAERQQADVGLGVGTGIDQRLQDLLDPAQETLDALAMRPGMESWGHLAGLRAIAGLVDAYVPLYDVCWLKPATVTKIQDWLRLATKKEPHQQRWHGAAALLAETLGDIPTAAQHTIRQWKLGVQMGQPENFTLDPSSPENLRSGRCHRPANQPPTVRPTIKKKKVATGFTAPFSRNTT
jgi:hypothetical protein